VDDNNKIEKKRLIDLLMTDFLKYKPDATNATLLSLRMRLEGMELEDLKLLARDLDK
jgi:hypothetical protein